MEFVWSWIAITTVALGWFIWLFFLEVVPMEPGNRMITPLRIGFNKGRFFIRIDLWWIGIRLCEKAL